jgi:hypothetical protein
MKLAALAAVAMLAGLAARPEAWLAPTTYTIRVAAEGPDSGAAPLRVVATSGTLTAQGASQPAGPDTARVTGPVELVVTDSVGEATFVADRPDRRLHAVVLQGGKTSLEGWGSTVVVLWTPEGARVRAMAYPDPPQRAP